MSGLVAFNDPLAGILAHEFIDIVAKARVCLEKGKAKESIRLLEDLEKNMWLLLVSVEHEDSGVPELVAY